MTSLIWTGSIFGLIIKSCSQLFVQNSEHKSRGTSRCIFWTWFRNVPGRYVFIATSATCWRIRVAPPQMHLSTNIAVRKGLNDRRNGQKGVKSGSPTFMQCMKVADPPQSSFNKALCGQCPLRETYARTGQSVPKPQITDQTFIDATSRENALHPTRDQLNSKPEWINVISPDHSCIDLLNRPILIWTGEDEEEEEAEDLGETPGRLLSFHRSRLRREWSLFFW